MFCDEQGFFGNQRRVVTIADCDLFAVTRDVEVTDSEPEPEVGSPLVVIVI
jgi:hypothetical protein